MICFVGTWFDLALFTEHKMHTSVKAFVRDSNREVACLHFSLKRSNFAQVFCWFIRNFAQARISCS